MKRRLIALLLVVCLLTTAVPLQALAATGLPFGDVPDGAWYLPAVQYAYKEQIMTGTSGNTFEPEANLTRAQMTQILYNMEGKPSVEEDAFTDVLIGDWFYGAVNWAASQGVVNGVGGGRFDPNTSITREQMVVMLCNYAKYKDYETDDLVDLSGYTDMSSISDYAFQPLQWAVGEGIISGVTETTIQPQGTATRAQVAQVLMTFCQNKEALDAFQAKNIDDFKGQTVLQYTDSQDTNFSVLEDDVIIASAANGVNRMVSEDDDAGIYVINQADTTIKGLQPGDKLFIPYDSDYFMAKIGTIKTNGSQVTITAADAVLDEFFSYIDVSMDLAVPADQLSVEDNPDDSPHLISTPTLAPAANPEPTTPNQPDGDTEPSHPSVSPGNPFSESDGVIVIPSDQFEMLPGANGVYRTSHQPSFLKSIGGSESYDFSVNHKTDHFTASLDMTITVTAEIRYDKYILDDLEIELSVAQETLGKIEVSAATKNDDPYKKELGSVYIPFAPPFGAELTLFATADVDAQASGSVTATFSTKFGGLYKNSKFQVINTADGELTADISGSVTASAGIGADGGITCGIWGVSVGAAISGEAGVTVSGTAEKSISTTRVPIKHICPLCVDGTMDFYINTDLNLSLDFGWLINWDKAINLWDKTIPFRDFYISFGGGETPIEFDWGDCPHYQYLVTIRTEDQGGSPVSNASIAIDGPVADNGTTDRNGEYYTYCDTGKYTVCADGPDGYGDASDSFTVAKKPVNIDLTLQKDGLFVPFTLIGDLYDAMDGLYDGDNRVGTVKAEVVSPTEMHITLANMNPVMGVNRHTNYFVSISPDSHEWTASSYVEIGGSDPTRTSAGFYSPNISGGSNYFTVSNPTLDTQKKQLTWTVKVNSGIDFDFSQFYGTNISAITNQKT